MAKKTPVSFYTLKQFYEAFRLNYTPSRDAFAECKRAHLYQLRGHLENTLWHNNLRNYDGSLVGASGPMKNGNFWRVSEHGILALYEHFGISDDLDRIAKRMLLGEL